MVRAILELDAKFAESESQGTLVKIAYKEGIKDAEMIKIFVNYFLKNKRDNSVYVDALNRAQVYYNETKWTLLQPYVLLDETMMVPFEMWNSVLHKAINWDKPRSKILWHTMFASYIPENDLETTSPAVLEKMQGWIA